MNWENKFSTILREAESNLSKTRRKYPTDAKNDWRYGKFSTTVPMRRASSLFDLASPLQSSFYQNGYSPASGVQAPNYSVFTSTMDNQTSSNALQNKLDQQNKLIEQLMQTVNKMENERSNYDQQIRDLKDSMYEMKGRTGERNPNIDSRLDQVKRELHGEIQMLQSQLQYYRSLKGDNPLTDTQISSIHRDMSDLRNGLRDDIELLRREIEIVKTRMNKLEMDVGAIFSNRKEIERQQSRLDRMMDEAEKTIQSVSSTMYNPPRTSGQFSSNSQSTTHWNSQRDSGHHHIQDLRSQVTNLKDKISQMEYAISNVSGTSTPAYTNMTKPNLYAGTSTPLSSHIHVNGYDAVKSEKSANSVVDLDELDLSEDESTDFEMFNPKTNFAKISSSRKSRDIDIGLDDDDLDLSDLDLSDDESLQNGVLVSDDL